MKADTSKHLISIHALLAESDEPATRRHDKNNVFLSTLSLRRATGKGQSSGAGISISIHALLAESDSLHSISCMILTHFYPRSPCGERQATPLISIPKPGFLSTLSLRRATLVRMLNSPHSKISIHALLAESDRCK